VLPFSQALLQSIIFSRATLVKLGCGGVLPLFCFFIHLRDVLAVRL